MRRDDVRELNAFPGGQAWAQEVQRAVHQAVLYGADLREVRRTAEEAAIVAAYEHEGHSWAWAAHRLGVTERTLQLRRKEHGPPLGTISA